MSNVLQLMELETAEKEARKKERAAAREAAKKPQFLDAEDELDASFSYNNSSPDQRMPGRYPSADVFKTTSHSLTEHVVSKPLQSQVNNDQDSAVNDPSLMSAMISSDNDAAKRTSTRRPQSSYQMQPRKEKQANKVLLLRLQILF